MKCITVGLDGLDEQGRLKIDALLEQYPEKGHLLKIQAFNNLDTSDEEEVPSGLVTIYSLNAPVSVDSIPEKSFNYLVVCPIKQNEDAPYTDADFTIDARLDEAAPQYSQSPPSIHNRSAANHNTDMNAWNAELGEEGFAGIFKKVKDNGRGADYYVVVQAGVPNATAEFKDYINSREDSERMTFENLLEDARYGYINHLAQRNAQRIAYNVARAYKVPLQIEPVKDLSAYSSDHYVGKPMRAAGVQQAQSTIKLMPQGFRGQEAVAVFHNVRPIEESNRICYVVSNPYDGIAIFNMKGNGLGIGLPATTGKTATATALEPLDQKTAQKRAKGLTWEGKNENVHHPNLHPDAYNTVDSRFLDSMKQLGWRQEGTDNREYLVPVAVKITNPDKKRP